MFIQIRAQADKRVKSCTVTQIKLRQSEGQEIKEKTNSQYHFLLIVKAFDGQAGDVGFLDLCSK